MRTFWQPSVHKIFLCIEARPHLSCLPLVLVGGIVSMCFVLVGFPVLYSLCVLYWFVFLFYIFYVFCIFPSWASPVWNQTCLALRALTGGKLAFATHCTVRTVFCSCMHVFCTLKSRKPASFTSLVSRSVPYLSGTLHLWGGIADTSDTRANQPPSTHLRRSPPKSPVISPLKFVMTRVILALINSPPPTLPLPLHQSFHLIHQVSTNICLCLVPVNARK